MMPIPSRPAIGPVWEGIGLRLRMACFMVVIWSMELCGRVVAVLSWRIFAVFCYHDSIIAVLTDI